ncbi:uncharacterized protein [Lepeophtheirus salmonis]|uniref:uncharacterized protein n=1 Tax=Lepeophtheirus salmonis TaxID=72036 RepID=UPI001AE994ED|nr:uncharacterized protein LOC121125222 [Lepeophtheirus salmonis]
MAATAYYQNREKAFNRTSRIHRDLNRASAYIFDSDANSLSAYSRPSGRSSSLTRDAPRYVDPSNAGYRFKDKLPTNDFHRRSIKIPIQTTSSHLSPSASSSVSTIQSPKKAYNKDFNPYSETARYKREQEMKDIHNDFMRSWKDQQGMGNGNEEKKSKSYHKIMGSTVSALEDRDFTRQTIGDIFKDMSKFSTKTVAALSTLDTSGANKTKNYNWRKEIEKYESTGQLERDARIRNIEIRNKRHEDETDFKVRPIRTQRDESAPASLSRRIRPSEPNPPPQKIHSNISRIAAETKVVRISTPEDDRKEKINHIVIAPKVKIEEQPAVASPLKNLQKEDSIEGSPLAPMENTPTTLSPVKKRAKILKKKSQKEEENVKDEAPVLEEVSLDKKEEAYVESSSPNETPKKDEEEEDVHGTKKMKDEFSSRMASLDAEMTAGRSNLARIRERIRKAKKGIMEVGEMIENS